MVDGRGTRVRKFYPAFFSKDLQVYQYFGDCQKDIPVRHYVKYLVDDMVQGPWFVSDRPPDTIHPFPVVFPIGSDKAR